jgi:DHA1 family bicyclomycin/chloramphenicol resistance-like MFS transporter
MAPIAGTASSVQGVTGTLGAAILGFLIGQAFDGTATPYVLGTAACTVAGFVVIVLTEPHRLFAPMQADPEEQEAAMESTAVPEDFM